MNERRNPYDRGPWKPKEGRRIALGAAILAGGVYGLGRLFVHAAHARQATAATRTPGTRGARFER